MVYERRLELVVVHQKDAMVDKKKPDVIAVHLLSGSVYGNDKYIIISKTPGYQAGIKFGEENKKQFLCKSREILY